MKKLPYLTILAAGVLWGCIGLFIKLLTRENYQPMEITAFRAYTACLLLVLFFLIKDKHKLKIHLKDIWCFVGTGFLSFVLFNYCYFVTIQESSLAVAAILLYTAPIMVMVMSLFLFKERLTLQKFVCLMLAVLGCALVSGLGGDMRLTTLGLITGVLSGFCYALYSIFGRYALRRYSTETVTVYTFVFASVGVTPFLNLPSLVSHVAQSPSILWAVFGLGLLSTVAPFLLYTKGLNVVESGKASIIASVEPVVATLISVFFFQEPLSLLGGLGVLLVIAAIVLLNVKLERKNAQPGG